MILQTRAIPDFLNEVVHRLGVPLIRVSVTLRGDTVRFSAGTCSVGEDLRYDLTSLGKLLTSLITLHLIARKVLSLDTLVVTYLPELAGTPKAQALRIWHLLSNTSGFGSASSGAGNGFRHATFGELLHFVRYCPQLFEPGTVFSYQYEDYRLLAEILRRVTGKEIPALIREVILEPLGIDTAAAEPAPRYSFDPSTRTFESSRSESALPLRDETATASLTTTGLGRLAVALSQARGGVREQAQLLAGAHLLLARKTVIPVAVECTRSQHAFCAYGLGCGEYWDGTLGHGGSSDGQCTALRFDTRGQLAIAMTISGSVPQLRDVLLTGILRMCGYPPAQVHAQAPAPRFAADELIGRYVGGDETTCVQVRRHDTELLCTLSAERSDTTDPYSDVAPPLVVFVLEDGVPILHPDSQHLRAVFFRDPVSGTPCLMLGYRAFRRWAPVRRSNPCN